MWRIGKLRENGDGFSLLAMGFTEKKAISQEKAHDQKIIPARHTVPGRDREAYRQTHIHSGGINGLTNPQEKDRQETMSIQVDIEKHLNGASEFEMNETMFKITRPLKRLHHDPALA